MQEMRVRLPLVPLFDSVRPSRLSEETVGLRTRSAWFNSTDGRQDQRVAQSEERLLREQEAAGAGPASLTASQDASPRITALSSRGSRSLALNQQRRVRVPSGSPFQHRGRSVQQQHIAAPSRELGCKSRRPHRSAHAAPSKPSRAHSIRSRRSTDRTADCRSANAGSIPVGTAFCLSPPIEAVG